MSSPPHIAAIILAAGDSTRLDTPKQLLLLNGTTLLRRMTEKVLQSNVQSVHIVLGYEAERMKKEIIGFPVSIIKNSEWQQGISTSIRAGLRSLDVEIDAAIIVLCDQPRVSTEILNKLIDAYIKNHNPLVTCRYAGTLGVPTLFNRSIFPELFALRNDRGAKSVIEQHSEDRMEIDFPDGEIDIDTVVDQEKMK